MFNFHKLIFPDTGISIVISYKDRYGKKRIRREYMAPNRFMDIEVPYDSDSFRYAASIKNLQEKLGEEE